jgi:VWFA-related protein
MTTTLLEKPRSARLVIGFACALGALSALSWHFMIGARSLKAQTPESTNIRVDVELVTVDVTVLDDKGVPIPNLKKDSFRLFEDGKEQEIQTFEEINEEAESALPTSLADLDASGLNHGKVALILFDDSHIRERETKIARDSAERFVKQHMKPQDLFAVAAYGKSLRILQNYTREGDKVVEAIRQPAAFTGASLGRLASSGAGGIGGASSGGSGDASSGGGTGIVRGIGGGAGSSGSGGLATASNKQESNAEMTNLLRSFSYLAASLSKIKGRKVIILYGGEFSISADIQDELQNLFQASRKANVVFYTIDSRGLDSNTGSEIGQLQNNPQPPSTKHPVSQSLTSTKVGFLQLTSLASSFTPATQSLMTTSFLAAGGGGTGGGGTGGGGTGGGGTGGGGTGGGGTGGGGTGGGGIGGGVGSPGGTGGGGALGGMGGSMGGMGSGRLEQDVRVPNVLRSLASETGGLSIFNTNNFNEILDNVSKQLGNYYMLGFVSNNPKRDGKLRKLEVKIDLKHATLKHRESYVDTRPADMLAGSKGEKSLAKALASSTPSTELPVNFRAFYFYDETGLARIPIEASLQTSTIELKKKGNSLAGDLNVMGIAYAENGEVAARFSETVQLQFDKEKEEAFRKQRLPYENYFKLRPGKYLLRLAFADQKGKVGSVEKSLEIPSLSGGSMMASSLVLMDRLAQLPELVKDIQSQLLDENNPLVYQGYQITPSAENRLAANMPVRVFYRIYNLDRGQKEKKFVAKVSLKGENGKQQDFPPVSIDNNVVFTGKTEAAVGLGFSLGNLTSGNYKLAIETSETVSNKSVMSLMDFQVQ